MAARLLDAEEVARRLQALPGWGLLSGEICRQFRFADFRAAIAFVGRVADAAEDADHHPDIVIHYNRVTLTLSTHDAGGLTAADFDLAAVVNRLAPTGSD